MTTKTDKPAKSLCKFN